MRPAKRIAILSLGNEVDNALSHCETCQDATAQRHQANINLVPARMGRYRIDFICRFVYKAVVLKRSEPTVTDKEEHV